MPAVVYDAILDGLTLRQILSGSYDPGATTRDGMASGAIDRSEIYGGPSQPKATLETGDLVGLIGGVSLTNGLAISSGTITLPFAKRADKGRFAGTLSHPAISATDALVVVTSIDSGQGRAVSAGVDVHFTSSDGATDPVSGSTGLSLAAQAFTAQFDHGPAVVNSSEVAGVTGWRVNPGITVRVKAYKGLTYPTAVYIVTVKPSIDLTFEDIDDAMGFLGSYTSLTGVDVYARRNNDGGIHVAPATTQHAKFSLADGLIVAGAVSASGQDEGQATIRCEGLALTGSVASAIP